MASQRDRQRCSWPRWVAAALAVALVALLQTNIGAAFAVAERFVSDLGWKMAAGVSERPERRVVVIDIDEDSLKEVGAWPWPRSRIEQLSRKLAELGVAVQVFDMVFPEPREGDGALREAWAAHPVVLGQIVSVDANVTARVGQLEGAVEALACPPFAARSHGFIGNTEQLAQSGAPIGHMTPRSEEDGVVRRLPALICHEGRAYPSLALTALWRLAQPATAGRPLPPPDWVAGASAGTLDLLSARYTLVSPSLPEMVVPLEANGDLRVPYRAARQSFLSVSAADVLAGRIDASLLRGTVALVGATAFGLSDAVSTPLAPVASGVEVHAYALVGLLDHRMPYAPAGAQVLQWGVGLTFLALLLTLTGRNASPAVKRLPLAGLALAVGALATAVVLQLSADLVLPWVVPALLALVGAALLAALDHALTLAQRERLSAHLGAYLPQPVARRLAGMDPSSAIQVDKRQISVLAADIRNFSAFAAHRPPDETTALLHAYFCTAVDVVERHGGVVETVSGDSILAVWNAYSDCADHQLQSLAAARELLNATRSLLEPRSPVHETDLVQPLALGIGLESGDAVVGSFGPQQRRAHAALGQPVSVAVRLQQMTRDLSFPILVGPHLVATLPAGNTEALGEYLLEGLAQHYTIHTPVGWAELVSPQMGWQPAPESDLESDPWSSLSLPIQPGRSMSVPTS
jgi:adenylate cyclase